MSHRFAAIDMQTTTFLLHAVKRIFPTFEFTWLGEEMEQNLPLEMDFRACSRLVFEPSRIVGSVYSNLDSGEDIRGHAGHEAANAARCVRDFADLKQTTLVLPEVMWAKKRVMVMECACLGSLESLVCSAGCLCLPYCSVLTALSSGLAHSHSGRTGGRPRLPRQAQD